MISQKLIYSSDLHLQRLIIIFSVHSCRVFPYVLIRIPMPPMALRPIAAKGTPEDPCFMVIFWG